MLWMTLFAIIIVAISSTWPSSGDCPDPTDSVVMVITATGWGTGFVVAPGIVMTAGHIVDDTPVAMITSKYEVLTIREVHRATADCAIVMVDGNTPSPLELSYDPVHAGDEISAYGSPFSPSMFGAVLKGHVVHDDQELCGNQVFFATLSGGPGMSGAPVMKDGKVVGIFMAMWQCYDVAVRMTEFPEFAEWLGKK
jgi:hypothetical protein